jgi:hypothetical protein
MLWRISLWLLFWWSFPVACMVLGGRFSNFIGLAVLAAATTTYAAWEFTQPDLRER